MNHRKISNRAKLMSIKQLVLQDVVEEVLREKVIESHETGERTKLATNKIHIEVKENKAKNIFLDWIKKKAGQNKKNEEERRPPAKSLLQVAPLAFFSSHL